MATYAKPLFDVAVGDIDTALVIKVIVPEWKRAPQTMDRVRRRIGEVLGFAEETPGLCDLGKVTQWSQNNKPTSAQWVKVSPSGRLSNDPLLRSGRLQLC